LGVPGNGKGLYTLSLKYKLYTLVLVSFTWCSLMPNMETWEPLPPNQMAWRWLVYSWKRWYIRSFNWYKHYFNVRVTNLAWPLAWLNDGVTIDYEILLTYNPFIVRQLLLCVITRHWHFRLQIRAFQTANMGAYYTGARAAGLNTFFGHLSNNKQFITLKSCVILLCIFTRHIYIFSPQCRIITSISAIVWSMLIIFNWPMAYISIRAGMGIQN
jgi:hypothetical protein